jgi:bacterioferritin-associated ferredoxin
MIVCVCKAVSDRTIRACVKAGASTRDELEMELGVGLNCGACKTTVARILDSEASSENTWPLVGVPA